ncbi:MAG: YjbQ family protein [Candidatus Verstraetearchaeota archaeon]|nr:YjbQ family protein [Candidatus Verstraetearchaeota archaeon]
MKVFTKTLEFNTSGEGEVIDLTERVREAVRESGVLNGTATVFVPGSTGAVTTIEYEPGLKKDIMNILERIAPRDLYYEHEKMWHDHNGHSHVRASLIGPSLTVPIVEGELILGTWQQIVFLELDVRSRRRRVVVQVMGV